MPLSPLHPQSSIAYTSTATYNTKKSFHPCLTCKELHGRLCREMGFLCQRNVGKDTVQRQSLLGPCAWGYWYCCWAGSAIELKGYNVCKYSPKPKSINSWCFFFFSSRMHTTELSIRSKGTARLVCVSKSGRMLAAQSPEASALLGF